MQASAPTIELFYCSIFHLSSDQGTFPLKDGFPEAWEQLRQQVQAIRLCAQCVSCAEKETCMKCAAVTYTETGSFSGKPEYMCRLNHSYRETLSRLAKALKTQG